MEFAPIVPVKYLNRLASLAHYHLVLAHWLTNKPYLKFYQKMASRGDFIILDNGCCELGESIDLVDLVDWYDILGCPDVLVLPDSDGSNNLELFHSSLEKLSSVGFQLPCQFMAVPHSIEDLAYMITEPHVDIIGLNRAMEEDHSRAKLIDQYQDSGKKFHLLGCFRNPVAEIESVRKYKGLVLGIDSSVPYSIFAKGRVISEYRPYPKHLDLNDKPSLSPELLTHCKSELSWFIQWVREDKV